MKFKLDENIGRRGVAILRDAGHDVMTVRDQGLGGAADSTLFEICLREGRALVTLDHDFAQVPRFPPERTEGVIVLEVGPRASVESVTARLRELLAALAEHSVAGALWIVEPGRIRMRLREP